MNNSRVQSRCRMCAGEAESFTSLLDTSSQIMKWVVDHFQIDVDDGLPTIVCVSCQVKVERWLKFEERSEQVQQSYLTPGHLQPALTPGHLQPASTSRNPASQATLDEEVKTKDLIKKYQLKNFTIKISILSPDILESLIENSFVILKNISPGVVQACSSGGEISPGVVQACSSGSEISPGVLQACSSGSEISPGVLQACSSGGEISPGVLQACSSGRKMMLAGESQARGQHFPCSTCGKMFSRRADLKKHQNVHTEVHIAARGQHFPCSTCGKIFSRRADLKKHQNVHTEVRCFRCHHCESTFKDKRGVRCHLQSVHVDVPQRPYVCPQCGKSYKRPHHLKQHSLSHENSKQWTCLQCDNSYQTKQGLSHHLRTHQNLQQYKCELCTKSFNHKANYTRHFRLHVRNLHVLRCFDCGKCFKTKEEVKKHVYVHLTAKNLQCDQCDASFKSKVLLRQHQLRIHRELRAHRCLTCDKRFKSSAELACHTTVHSEARPYVCPLCHFTFKRQSNLYEHKRYVHSAERKIKKPTK